MKKSKWIKKTASLFLASVLALPSTPLALASGLPSGQGAVTESRVEYNTAEAYGGHPLFTLAYGEYYGPDYFIKGYQGTGPVQITFSGSADAMNGWFGNSADGYLYLRDSVDEGAPEIITGGIISLGSTSFQAALRIQKGEPEIAFADPTVIKNEGDGPFINALAKHIGGPVSSFESSDATVAVAGAAGEADEGYIYIKGAGTATVTVTTAEDSHYKAGSASFTLTVRRAVPDVAGQDETIKGKGDGKIAGLDMAMETSTDRENYRPVADPDASFAPGTYYVRYAATGDTAASEPAEVSIGSGRYLTVTFRAEGAADVVVEAEYGGALADVPDIPQKAGYTAKGWDTDDFSSITEDMEVHAIYALDTDAAGLPLPGDGGDGESPSGGVKILEAGNYYYKVLSEKDRTAQVTGVKVPGRRITVYNKVRLNGKEYRVTSVAAGAFKGNRKAASAAIGRNVRAIGRDAFAGCTNLEKVAVRGGGLRKIGAGAFKGCRKLAGVTIQSRNLKKVGGNAFRGISSKAVIRVPAAKYRKYAKLFRGKRLRKAARAAK